MRQSINDNELEYVVGGTVIISKDYMSIGFSTTRQKFSLKNCTYREVRDYVEDLKDANPNMTNAEFDAYAQQKVRDMGWI